MQMVSRPISPIDGLYRSLKCGDRVTFSGYLNLERDQLPLLALGAQVEVVGFTQDGGFQVRRIDPETNQMDFVHMGDTIFPGEFVTRGQVH